MKVYCAQLAQMNIDVDLSLNKGIDDLFFVTTKRQEVNVIKWNALDLSSTSFEGDLLIGKIQFENLKFLNVDSTHISQNALSLCIVFFCTIA